MTKLPPLKVSKYDKLWLIEVYKTIVENRRPSYRNLRAKLYKDLPKEFDPDKIDRRLVQYRGEEIKLLGVHEVSPETEIIKKSNQVILAIKKLLIENPLKEIIEASEISLLTEITLNEVSLILRLISPYGKFNDGAVTNQKFQFGYSSINAKYDNTIFDQYLYFTDIRDLMNKHFVDSFNEPKFYNRTALSSENSRSDTEVKLNPIFKSKIDRVDTRLCFVLMPFNESWSDEIYELIKTTIESIGFQCLRADDLNGQIVIEDIWIKINQAGFIIADVTNRNPNVMYEVGIAHTVGRPTLLLTQNTKEIPFDFTHLRHIEYKNTVSGAKELTKKLTEAIKNIYKTDGEISTTAAPPSIRKRRNKRVK